MNQFGGGTSAARDAPSTYSSNSTGPPYVVANAATVNMEAQSVAYSLPSQTGAQMNLPTRGSNHPAGFTPAGFTLPDDNDMDLSPDGTGDQPSPATTHSQSRGGSTSQSSYSPSAQQNEKQNHQFRNSPKNPSNQMPLQQTTAANTNPNNHDSNANFFSSSDDMFSAALYGNQGTATLSGDTFQHGFLMNEGWDISALNSVMTPMS
jgi:hypothetical protein